MRWMWSLLALALAACGSSDAAGDAGLFCEVSSYGKAKYPTQIDLLFVVDTTTERQPFADALAYNVPRFVQIMQNITGGLPGVHVGVIAADGGAFRSAPTSPECTGPDDAYLIDERDPWFRCSDERGTRCGLRNYDGSLDEVLPCMVALPADSTEPRELLDSVARALDGSIGQNAGFDRRGTPLQIVIIAAGDDESELPVEVYAQQLHELSDDGIGPIVSVVAPDDSPRLRAFADAFPQRNVYQDIASEDWSEALIIFATLFARTLNTPCLRGVDTTDLYPDEPGAQLECAVIDSRSDGTERVLPACDMLTADRPDPDTPLPCWWVADYGADCDHSVVVEHDGNPTGDAEVRCVGTCEP